jgi:hypothetical protein
MAPGANTPSRKRREQQFFDVGVQGRLELRSSDLDLKLIAAQKNRYHIT